MSSVSVRTGRPGAQHSTRRPIPGKRSGSPGKPDGNLPRETVNEAVKLALFRIDCNYAYVYCTMVEKFQSECTMRELWHYLKIEKKRDWMWSYVWFTQKVMPVIRKQIELQQHQEAHNCYDFNKVKHSW